MLAGMNQFAGAVLYSRIGTCTRILRSTTLPVVKYYSSTRVFNTSIRTIDLVESLTVRNKIGALAHFSVLTRYYVIPYQ